MWLLSCRKDLRRHGRQAQPVDPQRGNIITLTGLQPEKGVTRGTDKVSTSKNNGFAASPNSCGSEACHDRKDTTGFKCDASERSRVPTDKKPSIPPLEVRGKG